MGSLIVGIVLGLWLMASPSVLLYGGAARVSAIVAGALAASTSWIALSEVTRAVRRFDVALGIWVVLSGFVLPQPWPAAINSWVVGLLLGTVGMLSSRIESDYGGGWSALVSSRPLASRISREVGRDA
jgi:hypothetical protein